MYVHVEKEWHVWCILGNKIEAPLGFENCWFDQGGSFFFISHLAMLHWHYYEVSLTRITGCWKRSALPWASLCKLDPVARDYDEEFFFLMHMRSRF